MAPNRKASETCTPLPRSLRKPPQRPYIYTTLLPGEIRLLVLTPGSSDDPLRGTLETVPLDEHPEYQAISYAWGEPIFPHTLYLPHGQLHITDSLFGALRRFRSQSVPVRLWADAICIDQNRLLEKNHQVHRMADIFGQASEVLVWLGEAQNSDCLVSSIFHFMITSMQSYKKHLFGFRNFMSDFLSFESHSTNSVCPQCDKTFILSLHKVANALRSFWQRPWFTRLWVIQEAAVAVTSTFFYGRHSVAAEHLHDVACAYRELTGYAGNDGATSSDHPAATHMEDVLDIIRSRRGRPRPYHDLMETMIRTRDCMTLKPLDRIFAIRTLARVQDLSALIPNYEMSLADLCTRAAVVELTVDSNWSWNSKIHSPILVLALVGTQQPTQNLARPSWAPDFLNLNQESERKFRFHAQESRRNWAGGKLDIDVVYKEQAGSIQILGKFVVRVEYTSTCSRSSRTPLTGLVSKPTEGYWRELRESTFPWYLNCYRFATSHARDEKLQNNMLRELFNHGRDAVNKNPYGWPRVLFGKPDYDDFKRAFEEWTNTSHSVAGIEVDPVQMYDVLDELLYREIGNDWTIDSTRVLAITVRGDLCWIPEASQAGDLVTLFQGSPFPFILRKREDGYYTVIGDAFVQDMMHGEEWPEDGEGVIMIGMK